MESRASRAASTSSAPAVTLIEAVVSSRNVNVKYPSSSSSVSLHQGSARAAVVAGREGGGWSGDAG